MSICPIHNHSEYSALDGLSTVREIAERCQCIGCEAVGLTDHGVVAGHLEFGRVLPKYGIKPIFGCELYHGLIPGKPPPLNGRPQRDSAHFIAGAVTSDGLKNLWRLVNAAASNYHFVGRVTWEMLEKYSEGLFATSACIQGLVPQGLGTGDTTALNRYLEIFGENFFIELSTYPTAEMAEMNLGLIQIAQERGIPLIYGNDAHFASPEQYEYHDAYLAMQTRQNIDTPIEERKMWHPNSLYIMNEEDVRGFLTDLPGTAVDEAIANSVMLANKCSAQLPEVRRHLPNFIPADCQFLTEEQRQRSAVELFIDLVEEGIVSRYGGNAPDAVWERAESEMKALLPAGLEHYFLQTWDFCRFCDTKDIKRGPGRGSAAGALIAYALGITDIEPLHYGLIFERFYNAGRAKGFPDIDNDFPKRFRKVVREYLKTKWGAENVKTIGTITRLKPKAVCEKTYKACTVTWNEMDAVKKILNRVPDIDILGSDSIGWSEDSDPGKTIYVMDHVGKEIATWISEQERVRHDVLWRWIDICDVICSRASGYGVHPSGVVVAETALDCELPAFWSVQQEELATQFPMDEVDGRMFVKQDLLGLRTLDTLEEWEKLIGKKVPWSGLEFTQEWPDEMWELLDLGLTQGVFQIEDGYARRLCEQFKPRSIEDLSVIVALNRPGPIRSGAPDSFIVRRNGGQDDKFDGRNIPFLEGILDDTYGWFLYQEQVIAYFSKLGYSLSDADAVRKILGKKKPEDMKALKDGTGEWEGKGYLQMAEAAGLPIHAGVFSESPVKPEDTYGVARLIWDMIENFAKYSFNKSHSVAYATIAFRTIYAKWQDPAPFIMALIKTNPDKAGDYVVEARRMDIAIEPPDVAHSKAEIALVDDTIYFGFLNVKGIAKGSADYLETLRDKYHFTTTAELFSALMSEGDIWKEKQTIAKEAGKAFKQRSPKQIFGSNKVEALENAGAFDNFSPRSMTMGDRQALEQEYLGVVLTDNTKAAFDNNPELLAECDDFVDFIEDDMCNRATVPGVITTVKKVKTKAEAKDMAIVTIEYHGREIQFAVFPQAYHKYKFLWRERTAGIFTLARNDRGQNFIDGRRLS